MGLSRHEPHPVSPTHRGLKPNTTDRNFENPSLYCADLNCSGRADVSVGPDELTEKNSVLEKEAER
jgi:hypothetical protein